MSNFTANFRRFLRSHTFSRKELALIESLERQRHQIGRVRAVINDPDNRYAPVLLAYLQYIQHLDQRDAIIVSNNHCAETARAQLRAITATHRHYQKIYGHTRPIGQILLLNSHQTKKLDQILSKLFAYASGPNSILIIHGVEQPATPFSHWLALSKQEDSIWRGGVPTSPSVSNPPRRQIFAPKFVSAQAAPGEICARKILPNLRAQIIPNSKFPIPNLKIAA